MLDLTTIITRDLGGPIRFWSAGCTRLYGWPAQDAIGHSVHELLRTCSGRSLADIDRALLQTGVWQGDLVQICRDGSRVVVAAHMVCERSTSGATPLVTESLVDVTALRDAEEKLRSLRSDAARDTPPAAASLPPVDPVEALAQFAAGIAHNFNNILHAIAGSAALIERRPDDAELVTRFIPLITDAASRGAGITQRIQLLAHQADLKPEAVAAADLFESLLGGLGETLGPATHVAREIPASLPRMAADRPRLEVALGNLVSNAVDAMEGGGTLRLAATTVDILSEGPNGAAPAVLAPGRYVRLSVIDTGHGMDAAILARAPEPFFTTKPGQKGTGLGLPMVKGFAEQSGGGLSLVSCPGRGTTAELWLPACRQESALQNDGMPPPSGIRSLARIQLVDDELRARSRVTEPAGDLAQKRPLQRTA